MGCRSALVGEVVSRSLDGRSTSRRWTWRGACRRSHQRRGRHRGGRRPRPVELPRPREVRVFRGVHLDAVRPGSRSPARRGCARRRPAHPRRAVCVAPEHVSGSRHRRGARRSIARRPCRPPSASATSSTSASVRRNGSGGIRSPQASARCCAAPPASRPGWSPPHVSARDPRCARPIPANPGSRRGLAALGEGVSWGFTESRAVQREEAGDRVR